MVYTDGRSLVFRRQPATVQDHSVTRRYTFTSVEEADMWYQNCKKDAVKSTEVQKKKHIIHGFTSSIG